MEVGSQHLQRTFPASQLQQLSQIGQQQVPEALEPAAPIDYGYLDGYEIDLSPDALNSLKGG